MEQFEQFCNEIIKTLIKPQVTVVSGNEIINEKFSKNYLGDLVHNRDRTFASYQYVSEWNSYRNILNRTRVVEYTKWLDMRGNHGEK
jgi:hypothetical protein